MNKDGSKTFWSFVVFAHSFVTGAFFCCLSAALFTTIAIGSTESKSFYAALAGAFIVLYTLDVTNYDLRFPRTTEAVTISAKLIAIYAFFAHVETGAMLTVFTSYVTIFFFINIVLDGFAAYSTQCSHQFHKHVAAYSMHVAGPVGARRRRS